MAFVGLLAALFLLPPPNSSREHRPSPTGGKRRALLIGISKYDRGNANTDWWDLSSDRDVDQLSEILAEPKFAFDEIKILKTPAETTHKYIVDTFRNWLIAPTKPGDIVFVHYSGHGSQAPDTNTPDNPIVGDEFSGLDETLVPSDYVSMQDPSKDIRDDEIGILLGELNANHPAQVFLSFDTCHAGSITRGRGRFIARGRQWTGPQPTSVDGPKRFKTAGGFLTRDQATGKGYVVLEASRDDQLAHQFPDENGNQMGLLTYALIEALNAAGPSTTYRDVFNAVSQTVTSQPADQDPQMEGDDIDNFFLSSVKSARQPYIPIHVTQEKTIILKAGTLQGITKGSVFGLFVASTQNPKESTTAASARVTSVDLTSSTLELSDDAKNKGIQEGMFQAGKAVEQLHNYGDNRLRLDMHLLSAVQQTSQLAEKLKALPLVSTVSAGSETWDVRICPGPCPTLSAPKPNLAGRSKDSDTTSLTVQRADGSTLAELVNDEQAVPQLQQILEKESRWRFVSSLANQDSGSHVAIEMRVVPVDVEPVSPCGDAKRVLSDKSLDQRQGRLSFAECDYVMIDLKNSGTGEVFVSVLDLQNNGSIGPLWPLPSHNVQENHIPDDDQWHRIPFPYVIKITKPYGREMFKAIATTYATDFSPVVDAQLKRGARNAKEAKAIGSPLGQLLRAATLGQRGQVAGVNPGDWSTATIIFDVVPPKSQRTTSAPQ
jgi:hypothetical protein